MRPNIGATTIQVLVRRQTMDTFLTNFIFTDSWHKWPFCAGVPLKTTQTNKPRRMLESRRLQFQWQV